MKKFKISANKLLKKGEGKIDELSYCVVIPFNNKHDLKKAIEKIKATREDIKASWWCDGMIIDKEDYERLLKKSKSIEILNELEEGEMTDAKLKW